MDENKVVEYDEKLEITPKEKNKNKTKKRKDTHLECKDLMSEEECKQRTDCLFNRTKKCQKKPTKKPTETKLDEVTHVDNRARLDNTPNYERISTLSSLPVVDNQVVDNQVVDNQVVDNQDVKENTPAPEEEIKTHNKDVCNDLNELKDKLKKARKDYDEKIRECEEALFGEFIKKYFNKEDNKLTHQDLLIGLQKYYIDEKSKNINFTLSMQEFIQKFSQKTPVKGSNYKRQHIFEALCRLLVYFNYDRGEIELGINKQFYKSLEGYIKGNKNPINGTILEMRVNEGSGSGIVDIFFKSKKNNKDDKLWACETIYNVNNQEPKEEPKDEYIMIQNKYYDQEKSNISNYDVTRIYTLADRTNKAINEFDGPVKIILMVNNGDAVSSNLLKAKQQYPGLLDSKNGVIGVSILDTWFQKMLYALFKSKTFGDFLLITKKEDKPNEIQLRFHQRFIIECTLKCIEMKTSKFIWGAVPRSGKSYMIGGLISERFKQGSKNNIVIILGALTETLQQFKDMFNQFSNFSGYKIIVPESNKKSDEGNLNIYLLSQEWLKDKVSVTKLNNKIDPTTAFFKENINKKFPKLFENGEIDLYFDEVHKGGSTDISEGIIQSFNNSRVKIDIFVMVTATFAKPTLRYENVDFIGSGNNITETIEWSYNDQQNMKMLNDETKKTMIINTRNGIQQEVLNNVFTFYQEYYGSGYLNALSSEYQKHPELVLISPETINIQSSSDIIVPSTEDIRNVFLNNLQCGACEKSKEINFYRNPANIFKKIGPVDDLLNFIYHHIYNYFEETLNYPIDSQHTELWFLPDKHLYRTDTECKDICNPVVIDDGMDEDIEGKQSIPNIEPLTRGLAIKICQHKGFDRYNVLIVHNTKLTYLGSNINDKVIFQEFNYEPGKERIQLFDSNKKDKDGIKISLSDQIKQFEKYSYTTNGKSLIILTGAKLRLGISLPCADIAFNFDDIKSIDNNYQTMFRVLTERTKPELKKYGYYLDFNKGRSIQFIYEYNKIYGEAKKLQTKEALEALRTLLFTFNYNGLNLIKTSTTDELNLYSELINTLELTEEGYAKFWSKKGNIVNLIKKSLSSSGNLKLLQKLKSLLNSSTVIKKKQDPKKTLKDGKTRDAMPVQFNPDTQLEEEPKKDEKLEEEEEEEEEDYGELINTIAEELPTIIALLAIFSGEDGYECNTIEECLQSNLRNISDISNLKDQCSCENIENSSILDCFLNSPGLINKKYKYNRETLKKIIDTLSELLNSGDSELLRNNLNFIFDNIKKLMTKSDGIIHDMTDKDIEEKIEQYLSIRKEEKDKHGEVFTPIKLIDEMFDKLPPRVWSNPDLKWLDPANGIGNFPMVAYKRLMKGLEKWEPSESKRSKHIIENMLYMIEINPKNVKISRKIFGSNAKICCADFLNDSEKCFRQFSVSTFDIIIGNPPFNEGGVGKGGGVLWKEFVFKSFELLNNKGFLCFIHPTGWRKPPGERASAGDVWVEFKKHNLIFLKISDKKIPNFPTVDYYVVQKTAPQKETYLINEFENNKFEGKISLYDLDFIPHFINNDIKTILNKVFSKSGEKFTIIRNQSFQPTKLDMKHKGTPHAYYYDPSIDDYLIAYKKYNNDEIPEYIDKNKIIMTYSNGKKKGLLYPKYYNNSMGSTSNTMYQLIEREDNQSSYITLLTSELINFILKITQYSEPPNYKNEFKILNMISKPNKSKLSTEGDVYRYYNISNKEKELIKKILNLTSEENTDITEIQAATGGHLTRKNVNKMKKSFVKIQAATRGHQSRKRTKKATKGGKNKTMKKHSIFKLW
jgi:hypothetical protein